MSNSFGKESQKIVALIECECEKDFRGYLPQFYLKSDRLEKGPDFETNIVTDMASLTGIRRASRLGENFSISIQ